MAKKDPFDTRKSYIPTPNRVQPAKAPEPEVITALGSPMKEEDGAAETSLLSREII